MDDPLLLALLIWPLVLIALAPGRRLLGYAAAAAGLWYVGGVVVLLIWQQQAGAMGTIFLMMVSIFWAVPLFLIGLKLLSFDAIRWLRRTNARSVPHD